MGEPVGQSPREELLELVREYQTAGFHDTALTEITAERCLRALEVLAADPGQGESNDYLSNWRARKALRILRGGA